MQSMPDSRHRILSSSSVAPVTPTMTSPDPFSIPLAASAALTFRVASHPSISGIIPSISTASMCLSLLLGPCSREVRHSFRASAPFVLSTTRAPACCKKLRTSKRCPALSSATRTLKPLRGFSPASAFLGLLSLALALSFPSPLRIGAARGLVVPAGLCRHASKGDIVVSACAAAPGEVGCGALTGLMGSIGDGPPCPGLPNDVWPPIPKPPLKAH
mmetsp:Transcript_44689/g.112028  ORF Transcript_44689/g.112028 Transcript_44689/m.112028 type:complete len:216 (+) Transcript_44689:487-1134(+)